jgi:6-phosphofructokinase 1
MGVPKTIDNDLPHTDHCPGYGSVIKYNAATVMEIALDVGAMATDDGSCVIIEVMGRSAGWIAAGAVLAKRSPDDAPHIILVPEIAFQEPKFLERVKETIARLGYCVVVVGEGLKDAAGRPLAAAYSRVAATPAALANPATRLYADTSRVDAFGHPVLSGMGEYLEDLLKERLKIKSRSVKLGYAQRAAGHFASLIDATEAAACGEAAVRAAVNEEKSGFMVKIVRLQSSPYKWTTDLQSLADIANVEHFLPRDWMSEDGFLPNEKFIEYARPLIQGEVKAPIEGGLPKYVVLERSRVEKKLAPRV